MSNFLTLVEIAEQLKVSPQTIIKAIKGRELTATKVGKLWRVSEDSLTLYLNNRTIKADKLKTA